MNAKRREATFLVRMWRTEETGSDGEWRGSVYEIASGRRLFVAHTRDVADFIATRLEEAREPKG